MSTQNDGNAPAGNAGAQSASPAALGILIIIVWLTVFALRALLRLITPHAGAIAEVIADGTLIFAISALVVSYLVIYRRMHSGLIFG